ncbi:MAG: 50S ribosomal protein L11 methyltransferase [Acidobacteria bacterium]|nr:50S ribosomal protein L11 methyltransferase [Acidobacteriota bacterium]
MRQWFAVDVTVVPRAREAVESAFAVMGATGTAEDGLRKKSDEPRIVTGFFEEAVSLEDVEDAVGTELEIHAFDREDVQRIEFRTVEEEDWLAEWKKHWKPTEVGRFIIAPTWSPVTDTDDKFVIKIEPSMAFGTGTHETTQLCLEALDDIITPGMSVIDVGTGTGVLAIAAAKLGCKHIRAYDTDAPSVSIAEQNAEANGVIDSINFYEGAIEESIENADLIIANITLDVIKPILGLLIEKADIWLLLSGILATQRDEIQAELKKFEIGDLKFQTKGEWISVLVGT